MNKKSLIIIAVAVYLTLGLLAYLLLPVTEKILQFVEQVYQSYGYTLIFLFSFLEGIFVIGMFIPGTAIVIFGATMAGKGMLSLPLVIISGALGLLCGSIVSYWLGRLGWYRLLTKTKGSMELIKKAQSWHSQLRWMTFLSFASTGIGSAIGTLAGIIKFNFNRYLIFVSLTHLFWVTVWSLVGYFFGGYVGNGFVALVGILATIMIIFLLTQWLIRKKAK